MKGYKALINKDKSSVCPALPGMDLRLRQRAPHRRPARPHHPPCSYPGDERRELSAQAEPIPTTPVRITPRLPPWAHRDLPRAGPPPAARRARRPARGSLLWATGTSYRRSPWCNFTPPRRYIFSPPLTNVRNWQRDSLERLLRFMFSPIAPSPSPQTAASRLLEPV